MQKIKTIDNLFYQQLGNLIRKNREHLDMTQKELAQEIGVTRTMIINFEYGYTKIKPTKWEKICDVLSIPQEINVDVYCRR